MGLSLAALAVGARADTVESVSGAVIEGKVTSRDDKFIVMDVQVRGKPVQRKFLVSQVRAVTVDGKREVLKGGPSSPAAPRSGFGAPGTAPNRTRQEVEALIAESGKAHPEWLEATKLNVPDTLDLTWPEPAKGDWNNQKNVGQFLWDVIYPNEGRWREGVRLMHHLMEMHKDDRVVRTRAMATLGSMYHNLFQDYARAAYWWRQGGKAQDSVGLAECYFKLGSKPMAVQTLNQLRQVPPAAIKLWGDMGETEKAIKLSRLFEKSNAADVGYLYAGDACRFAGRFREALAYYEKALAVPDTERNERNKTRARASIEAIRLFETFDLSKVADGVYTESSQGYEGPITVEVKVAGGRITDVKVVKHREKQYYAAITDTTAQVIRKQSVKGIDATSRATITSEAIINATAKALQGGTK